MTYIDQITCENAGGGSIVDFIHLWDGRVIALNDEYAVLYKSIDEFWDATPENRQTIELRADK
jgi:hypothetical protein